MPTFEVTFVPKAQRDPLDPRWTSTTETVEAADPEQAVAVACGKFEEHWGTDPTDPYLVQSIKEVS